MGGMRGRLHPARPARGRPTALPADALRLAARSPAQREHGVTKTGWLVDLIHARDLEPVLAGEAHRGRHVPARGVHHLAEPGPCRPRSARAASCRRSTAAQAGQNSPRRARRASGPVPRQPPRGRARAPGRGEAPRPGRREGPGPTTPRAAPSSHAGRPGHPADRKETRRPDAGRRRLSPPAEAFAGLDPGRGGIGPRRGSQRGDVGW